MPRDQGIDELFHATGLLGHEVMPANDGGVSKVNGIQVDDLQTELDERVFYGCRLEKTSSQSIGINSWTDITWTGEIFDHGNLWTSGAVANLPTGVNAHVIICATIEFSTGLSTSGGVQLRTRSGSAVPSWRSFQVWSRAINNYFLNVGVLAAPLAATPSDDLKVQIYQTFNASGVSVVSGEASFLVVERTP